MVGLPFTEFSLAVCGPVAFRGARREIVDNAGLVFFPDGEIVPPEPFLHVPNGEMRDAPIPFAVFFQPGGR